MRRQAWIRRTHSGASRRVLRLYGIRERMTEGGRMSQTRFINPQALGKPPGYTHVVEVTAPARIVYIAGQLGVDRDGKVVGDFRQQAEQTFENLKAALAAVGADFHDVVKLNNYLVDRAHLPTFREVRDSYLAEKDRPASTTIAISGLAREGALIEIEAVAMVPAVARSKARSPSASKRARKAARPARRPSRARRK
jgi:enamine deaminase RidA (YjgF/YER057c/UK114 family)